MVVTKRGLSDIVTNVLIVLLVLVAVGIIWFFIQPFIREGIGGVTTDTFTVVMGVQSRSVYDNGTDVNFSVERKAGKGNLVAFNVIITDVNGNSKVVRKDIVLGELESIFVSVNYQSLGLGAVKSVSVVPIISDQSGNEQNGHQSAPEAPVSNQNTGSSGSCTGSSACLTTLGYPGAWSTCSAGVWGGSCDTTLSCGDGVKTTPPEVCEYHNTASYYGASCDYGALPEFGNPGFLFGNTTCTNSCTTNVTCSCYVDFNHNGLISDGDDSDAWNTAYSNSGDPLHSQTDCNHDGNIDSADVACFNFLFADGSICNYQGP